MKYYLLFISLIYVMIFTFLFGPAVYAIGTPFGGRVTSTTQGTVICQGGIGPVTHQPAGQSTASPYFYPSSGGSGGSKSPPSNNNWVLGLYQSFMDFGSCYTQAGPYRIPYPVYRVNLFGKSR